MMALLYTPRQLVTVPTSAFTRRSTHTRAC